MLRQKREVQKLVRLILLVTISLGILWLSLTPSPPVLDADILGWDKVQHALAYGVLALVTGLFLNQYHLPARQVWGIALIYAIVFGGTLEVLQAIAGTGRSCEWGDLVADAIGASTAGMIGLYLQTRNKR